MKEKEGNRNTMVIIVYVLLGLIMFLMLITILSEQFKVEYYKTQMLSFCEISSIKTEIIKKLGGEVPFQEEDCKYWILSSDKEKGNCYDTTNT